MFTNLLKSTLHNVGVLIVGLGIALGCTKIDSRLGISRFHSIAAVVGGWLLLVMGFLLRLWATFYFYESHMKVISLRPQQTLVIRGPYRISRNPLYLGGNVFIFFGAAFVLGSPTALVLTAIHLPLMDLFIRREERQLEKNFGEEWRQYRQRVRRWI
jgi:protein-S-isoprenylcysteine O-methyltransferase Ste14